MNSWFRGLSQARWAASLGAAAAGATFVQTCVLALRGQTPATRVLLPGIVFVELLRVAMGQTTRGAMLAVVVLFELCLIGFAVRQLRRVERPSGFLEERFDGIFRQFLPDRISAFASRELVLVW